MSNLLHNLSMHSLNTVSQRALVLFSRPRTIVADEVESPSRQPNSSQDAYNLSHIQRITTVFPPEIAVQQLRDELERAHTVSALLESVHQHLPDVSFAFFQRIQHLQALAEVEDDMEMSLASLRNALLFVCLLKRFRIPSVTLNDGGLLQMNWRVARDQAVTLRFDEAYQVSYVIFRPSHFTTKRVILNGGMYILDVLEYLTELNIHLHKDRP